MSEEYNAQERASGRAGKGAIKDIEQGRLDIGDSPDPELVLDLSTTVSH